MRADNPSASGLQSGTANPPAGNKHAYSFGPPCVATLRPNPSIVRHLVFLQPTTNGNISCKQSLKSLASNSASNRMSGTSFLTLLPSQDKQSNSGASLHCSMATASSSALRTSPQQSPQPFVHTVRARRCSCSRKSAAKATRSYAGIASSTPKSKSLVSHWVSNQWHTKKAAARQRTAATRIPNGLASNASVGSSSVRATS